MKNAAVLLLSLAAFAVAQDKAPETVKRLDSVTWDLNTHKLVWVVQTGTHVDGEFVPSASSRYEVSPDEASMMFADEKRGLTEEEASSLHNLLDILSLYCAESTVWWDKSKTDSEGRVPMEQKTTTTAKPDGKPVKVDQPQQPKVEQPQPQAQPKRIPVRVLDGNMVAQAH